MRVWIDVENPPQVQYLIPVATAFEEVGAEVMVTARDYGSTFDLLEARGVAFRRIGASYGTPKWRKAVGLLGRTARLVRTVAGRRRPDVVVHAGRAAPLAAWALGIPSFCFLDYEFVDVTISRATRSWIVHPRAIPATAFTNRGIRADRLVSYHGLKEHLTFAGLDFASVVPLELPGAGDGLVRVLVRPPAEESHYYRTESGRTTGELMAHLASQEHAQVILSPRSQSQTSYLDGVEWRNEPVVLPGSTPFMPLLKAVDAVVASGGTMVREAAYLGIPSYSIFQGDLGGVDRYLVRLGRLDCLSSPADFSRLRIEPRPQLRPLDDGGGVPREVVDALTSRLAVKPRAAAATLV